MFNRFRKKSMGMSSAKEVARHFNNFDIDINVRAKDDIVFTIYNPSYVDRNIIVIFDKRFMTFYFSYQHAHFEYDDRDGLIDYISGFLSNKFAAIEFFEDGIDSFGGSREYGSIDFASPETLGSLFCIDSETTHKLLEQLKQHRYQVGVECWDSAKDKYLEIVRDGSVLCTKEIETIIK